MLNAIAVIMVRILAASIFFWALYGLSTHVAMLVQTGGQLLNQTAAYLPWIIVHAAFMVIGVLLWVHARGTAPRLIDGMPAETEAVGVDNVIEIGSFLIGLYIVLTSAPRALAVAIGLLSFELEKPGPVYYDLSEIIDSWLLLIAGLGAMAGARHVTRLFRFIRRA